MSKAQDQETDAARDGSDLLYEDEYEDALEDDVVAMLRNKKMRGRRKSISAEGYDPEKDTEEVKIVHSKSADQRQRLSKALKSIILFASLDAEQSESVLDAMFMKQVKKDEHVIEEGDDGDNFYVIETGNYDVLVKDPSTGQNIRKFTYTGSGSFGELALLYNCPRSATVVATSDGTLWAMDRSTFRRIIVKNAAQKRAKYEKFLKTVPLLCTLTDEERCRVADAMGTATYKKKQRILEEGGKADFFYIVMEGKVLIKRKTSALFFKREVELARCGPGDYFGELALITNKPRAASAIVGSPTCTCAILNVEAFERLLGPCRELLMRNIELYQKKLKTIDLR